MRTKPSGILMRWIMLGTLALALSAALPANSPSLAVLRAAQQPDYNTGFLTDAQLENYTSMTVSQIRDFLTAKGSYFRQTIQDVDGVTFDPAQVIADAASKYRINPQVILCTLQKESSGVTSMKRPSEITMAALMGCSAGTARAELACSAQRFREYQDEQTQSGYTRSGWRVGVPKTTQDGVTVTPANKAVAGQFTYTPYAGAQWGGNDSRVGGVYLFYNAWRQFGFGSSSQVPSSPSTSTATVLIMDISGSMGSAHQGTRKIDAAKDAATDVVNMAEQESGLGQVNHQVAIATFSNDAQLNLPLTNNYADARSIVAGLGPTNRTNIGAGLQTANTALQSAPAGSKKIAILLSDGLTNEGLSPAEILSGPVQDAVAAGTCIYTIGFGNTGDLDETLLNNIANATGCKYYYAPDAYQLQNVYVTLRHESLGTIIGQFDGQVQQNQTVTAGTVLVSGNQGQLYATVTWPGSALDLILTDPRGRKVTAQYAGATISTFEKLVYVIVENPLAGKWSVDVFGRDVPEGTAAYNTVLSVRERVVQQTDHSGLIAVLATLVVGILAVVLITQTSTSRAGVFLAAGAQPGRFLPMRGASFTLGRDPRSNLVLADHKVSRNHAIIIRDAAGYAIQDLNSSNGTFVNGRLVRQQRLRSGDQIRVGDTTVIFRS